ncbi:MAG: hypothetical protein MJZ34_02700 [Paludibacteraceae bacterium]|nr:hypothetical protein [Paludibacteraceae bacterium]
MYPITIKPMTKQDYDTNLQKINANRKLNPVERKLAINLLNQRFKQNIEYFKPDDTGFSQADRDSRDAQRQSLEWKAKRWGMSDVDASKKTSDQLLKFIDFKLQEKFGGLYDESEVGSPDFTSHCRKET